MRKAPKMKHTSKKAPRKYYRPSNDTKTFQINNKGHLQCLQDSSTSPTTKANCQAAGKHQSTMNQDSVMQDHGGFEETIPQLIRQTWQLERSLQHQDRPFSQASNACQEEGANRVQGGNRQGTGLLDRRGNHHGAG